METTTLEQLEKMREEARALESQTKSLPVLLSITFIPFIFACAYVAFPEDSKGVLLLGKLWFAGIIIGLMVCSYLSAALQQATNFRKYWPSLLCGLIIAVPPTIATISRVHYGLTLVQWSVTLGVISCAIGLFLYLKRVGENKSNFNVHFVLSMLALLVLYAQLQSGLSVAYNFPLSAAGQVIVCAFYPFVAAIFRRICVLFVPTSGRFASEMFSIYFAAMTYRILTLYLKSWGVFVAILVLEILTKWVFYSVQLSDAYFSLRKRMQARFKNAWVVLPARFHRLSEETEDTEDLLAVPLATEKKNFHQEVSFLFFVQTHADVYMGLGLALVQLTVMKLVGTDAHDCFSAFFADFMNVTWKYSIIALAHITNLILFYFFATKLMKKDNFSPVLHGTTKISSHHVKLLVTNVSLFLLVFILFFKSYGDAMSSYCPIKE